jgi:uncharacterized protein (DUF362 family)/NAD-dependent dihydropyrimidine dehydrogenase PreA subunit
MEKAKQATEKKAKVAIVRCESYDEKLVYNAVKKGIELIGGIDLFAKKGENILLKVNNLAGAKPEEAVCTHPSVLNAVIKILLEKKFSVFYGDSPGFEKPAVGLAKSGLKEIGDRYNLEIGDFEKGRVAEFPKAMACNRFNIANACLEADGIISLSKMKTHELTKITGAVKNQMGCVYGLHKAALHARYPNPLTFSKMLVDLNNLIKPRLFIMDAIIAMEGNGPRAGEPVKMNCIIVSADPVAVDATFCKLINLNPSFVPTNRYGKSSGLGNYDLKDIDYLGDPLNSFIKKKFKASRTPIGASLFRSSGKLMRNAIYSKPVIVADKCTKCGICVNECPVEGKALQFKKLNGENGKGNGKLNKKEPPVYDYKKCIRCYCCQEMCPYKAIYLKKPLIRRILGK